MKNLLGLMAALWLSLAPIYPCEPGNRCQSDVHCDDGCYCSVDGFCEYE
jgi:hypothetical protein